MLIFFAKSIEIDDSFEERINKVEVSEDIINRHDFEYLQNPGRELCSYRNKIFLLIYVHSSPQNLNRRMAIRETWAKNSLFLEIKTIFVMGVKNNQSNEEIKLEHGIYNDIVQENFEDSYRNLTYKGIAALKWISHYCTNTKFVLKADDDMIIDMFALLNHLKGLIDHNAKRPRIVMCNLWNNATVSRKYNKKWFVTKAEYKEDWFGSYCSGSAFILTSDIVPEMFNASLHVRFFWIDDYYISGLLVRAINASYESINSLYKFHVRLIKDGFRQKNGQLPVFSHSPRSVDIVYEMWKMIISRHLNNNHDKLSTQFEDLFVLKQNCKLLLNFEWNFNEIYKDIPILELNIQSNLPEDNFKTKMVDRTTVNYTFEIFKHLILFSILFLFLTITILVIIGIYIGFE